MFAILVLVVRFLQRMSADTCYMCCAQALMWACAGGHAGVVKLLLINGADASKQKHDGKCAVDIAAFRKHHQVRTARQMFASRTFCFTLVCNDCIAY